MVRRDGAIKPAHISEIRGRVLFGSASDVDQWASRLGRGEALVEEWNFAGVPEPKVALPLILTAVLVATAVPMHAAVDAGRNGRRVRAWWLIALALVVQTGYFAMQVHLLAEDIGKVDPQVSSYGSIYVTLVGAGHAHVFVGLVLDLWLLARLATGLTNYRLVGLRVIAFYWYFVYVVSVAIVLTQISPAL